MQMTPFFVSGIFIAASALVFGLFVYLKDPRRKLYQLWLLFNLSVGVWGIESVLIGASSNPHFIYEVWKIGFSFGPIWIPMLFLHFVYEFCSLKKDRFLYTAYISAFTWVLINSLPTTRYLFFEVRLVFDSLYYLLPGSPLFGIFTFWWFFLFSYSLWLLIKTSQKSTPDKRNQIRYTFVGIALGFIGGGTNFLIMYGVDIYPWGNFAIAFYPLIMGYAILKHQLLDIKIVIQKTILYTFWTLFISVGYIAILFLMQGIFLKFPQNSTTFEMFAMPINIYKWSGAVALITNSSIALFIYFRNRNNLANIKFSLFSLAIAFWAVGSWYVNIIADKETALWVLRVNYSFGVFVPVLFLDFTQELTGSKKKAFLVFGYFVSVVLAGAVLTTSNFINGLNLIPGYNFYISRPGWIYYIFVAHFSIYMAITLVRLCISLRSSEDIQRRRLWYVFLAYFIGLIAGLEYFCSVFGFLKRPPLDDYALILTFFLMSYAMLKHGLLDIRIIIKKTLFYSLLAFLISTFYVLIIFFVHTFFVKEVVSLHYLVNSVFLILLITLFLRPFEMALRSFLDKRFFKGTIVEIAEQKAKLETELERRERLKSVGILAAGMAHEIKNPLTAIKTFADYLPEKKGDPEFIEKFSRIVGSEVERIRDIVVKLLMFSKPTEPSRVLCDMKPILTDIGDLLNGELIKRSIKLEYGFAATRSVFVDPEQMKQAFLNIVLNAMDAAKVGGGSIEISAREHGKWLEVCIADQGVGIASEKIPHIFDPFYTSKEGGTGLGLAITHSIVEKNGGKIKVESELGQGTSFFIYLPVSKKLN